MTEEGKRSLACNEHVASSSVIFAGQLIYPTMLVGDPRLIQHFKLRVVCDWNGFAAEFRLAAGTMARDHHPKPVRPVGGADGGAYFLKKIELAVAGKKPWMGQE